jgi:hypothetical protein
MNSIGESTANPFSGANIEKTEQSSNLPTKPESSQEEVGRRTITSFSFAIKICAFLY